ncbi:type II secretion system major pseudopilin GspG [Boseongicola sp. H5]|uniref:type II secretion system major pseudopilin GspG n=1 Tax=Rhodobacterales TaxID=204455 RepID=UPI001B1976AB|nr:type II secretion system major pseudopilin GspG [Boseongicola sp. H5]MBO6603900.1 type II secretion system major pseudopilin GspG [Roseicyclus sp.]MBO6624860.1 type II secretion system major pseudopilin GspG [Roseicyclus sp.]MBO6924191.1 type II secretion system major pseudopilin GspG [Roseicyclus sp.]
MISKYRTEWTARSGVTILEVLVVLAIVALLAGVAGPRLLGYLDRARSETAELQIAQIKNALQLFYIDLGRYPTAAEGLGVLMEPPVGEPVWSGPYLESVEALTDPWGRDYVFTESSDGSVPQVSSFGRDGTRGGTGQDADIGV